MRLWWIRKIEGHHGGNACGFLVRASTEQEAFKVVIAHESVVKYGEREIAIWTDPDQVSCVEFTLDGPPKTLFVDYGDT
jgi:hypothetical protein